MNNHQIFNKCWNNKGDYMNTKNNITYKANEKNIKENFLKLLNEKDIKNITVSSICTLSNINRSTFYAHYKDVYDLLDCLEKEMNKKFMADLSPSDYIDFYESGCFIRQFLKLIKDNIPFYKACLNSRTSFPIKDGFDNLWSQIVKPLCIKNGITSEDEMMYYFIYYQAGFTMVLKHWVNKNCVDSIDDVEKYLKKIMFNKH